VDLELDAAGVTAEPAGARDSIEEMLRYVHFDPDQMLQSFPTSCGTPASPSGRRTSSTAS